MAKKQRNRANDDIERGNTGTADQGPGDVSPHEHVDAQTGVVPARQGPPRDKRDEIHTRKPGPVK